jgi:hypothetical protein
MKMSVVNDPIHEHNDDSMILAFEKYKNKNKLKFIVEFERSEKQYF